MAQAFNLTAQLQLQGPRNVNQVVNDIRRQLKPVGVKVNIQNTRNLAKANKDLQSFNRAARDSRKNVDSLNRTLQESARRFSVITLATGSFLALANSFKNSVKEAVAFERELVRISQVTGKSVRELKSLSDEVTRLSTSLGASSKDLLNVARTLSQAGFAADNTRRALDILAKTSLGATFDSIQDTTEGAIALLRQFGNEARSAGGDIAFLEKSLDAINSVSKRFAVESGDLITVIRRTGGVFSAAGGSVNELIALFTSVRATTRESAETIATGLRTIFTRLQRTETVQQLKALNIELQDSQGQFVGAFEAVRRLSVGLSALNPRDFRFSQIVEELGGFRQIGKVIPLITQFTTAQEALNVAQGASGSVSKDAITAQQSLGVQVDKVRQQFDALIRKFQDSSSFKSIAGFALKLAEAFIKVADALEPVLPLLTSLAFLKLGSGLAPAVAGLAGIGRRAGGAGPISKFARGGMVPGVGNRDTVPAMLTPGEFVIRKSSVNKLGASTLAAMNQNGYAAGGKVTDVRYNYGIPVASTGRVTKAAIEKASISDLNNALKNTNLLPASRAAIQEKLNQKSKAKPDKTTEITVTGATLGEQFGVAFLDGLPKDVSSPIKSMLKASNATGKGRFFDALKRSANRQEVDRGIAPNKRIKTGQQALARYVPDKTRIKAPFASQNTTVLQGEGKEIFNDEIAAGIPRLFQDATKKFKGELGIGAQVPLNKLLSNSAIGSIEGQFFEAYIRNVTGKIIKDKNDAIFDFAAGSLSDSKQDLDRLFGPGAFNTGIPQEFKNRGGAEQVASAIGKGLSIGTAGDLRFSFMNKGGGISGSDTVPAMLTPGEFVFNKDAARSIGYDNLKRMNQDGVKGFAAGGVVTAGRNNYGLLPAGVNRADLYPRAGTTAYGPTVASAPALGASASGFAGNLAGSSGGVDLRKAEQAYFKELKKSGSQLQATQAAEKEIARQLNEQKTVRKQQIQEIQKSNREIQKNNTLRKKLGGALASASGAVAGGARAVAGGVVGGVQAVGRGLDRVTGGQAGRQGFANQANAMAGAAQSAVFLAASVGAVTSQMSGLSDAQKQAINETAGFATGIVGLGGTLVQILTSMGASSSQAAIASQLSATADTEEAAASSAAAARGAAAATAFGIAAIAVAAVVIALKYASASAKAQADAINKERKARLDAIKETGQSDFKANELSQGLEEELALRQKSAEVGSNGALATAAAYAAAGAALGSFIPGLGTAVGAAIGGIAGGLAGYLKVTSAATDAVDQASLARQKEAQSIAEVYEANISLAQSSYELNSALSAIESAPGLEGPEKTRRRLEAQQIGAGEAVRLSQTTREKTAADAKTLGLTQAQLKALTPDEVRSKGAEKGLDTNTIEAIALRSQVAFSTLEDAAKIAATRVQETGKTLQGAISGLEFGDSKNAVESQRLFAEANRAAVAAIQEEQAIKLQSAVGEEARQAVTAETTARLKNHADGINAVIKAKKAEAEATKRAVAAQIATAEALRKMDTFLNNINNLELNLDKQAEALDNFAAVIDNTALKIKASGVDEIGNISGVKDLAKFSQQISSVTSGFGPQAQKVGAEVAQTAGVLNNARKLIGRNFSVGDPIDADQLLKSLGLTPQLLGPGGQEVFNQIAASLRDTKGTITEDALADIFGPLEKLGTKRAEVIQKLIGVEQKSIDNYQKFLDVKEKLRSQEIEQKQREVDAIKNSADLRAKADELIARSTGREQNPADVARATRQRNQQARRVRNQAQLSGIRVNGQQLDAGNAGNVAAVRQQAITERKQVQQQIAAGNSSRDLIKRQQQLKVVIDSTTKVLEDFANQGDAANDIFAEMEANISLIEKEKNARQQMLGVIEEFVVGGQDARKNLIQASQGIRLAFATGTLQNQTPEQRQATVSLLDKLSDIELAPGFTGKQIKQELVLRDAIRMGLDPEIAKQLATATSTEEKLIDANKLLAQEITKLTEATVESTKALDPQALSSGGMVQYRAAGGTIFKPRGTDTVPAMLTPGEFVIRKSAVDKIGVGNLQALNNGGGTVPGFANGGVVYASNGFFNDANSMRAKILRRKRNRTIFPKGSLVPQELIDRNLMSREELLEQGRRENIAYRKKMNLPEPLDVLDDKTSPSAPASPLDLSGVSQKELQEIKANSGVPTGQNLESELARRILGPQRLEKPVDVGGLLNDPILTPSDRLKPDLPAKPDTLLSRFNKAASSYLTGVSGRLMSGAKDLVQRTRATDAGDPTVPPSEQTLLLGDTVYSQEYLQDFERKQADIMARAASNPNFPLAPPEFVSAGRTAPQIPGPRNINDFTSASEIIASTTTASIPAPPSFTSWEFVGYDGKFDGRVVGGGGDYLELESPDGRRKRFKFDQFAGASRSQAIKSRNEFLNSKKGSGFGGTQDVGYFFGGGFINPFSTFRMMMGQMNAGTNFMMNRAAMGMPSVGLMSGPAAMRSMGIGPIGPGNFMGGGVGYRGGPRYEPLSQAFGGRAGQSATPLGFSGNYRNIDLSRMNFEELVTAGVPVPVALLMDGDKYDFDDPTVPDFFVERILEEAKEMRGYNEIVNELDAFMKANFPIGPNNTFKTVAERDRMRERALRKAERLVDTYDVTNTLNFAVGGRVPYFSKGGAAGGDSVPAMLTPGEFVMSADSVKKHGVGFMQSLNGGNVPGFNKGGMVQYRQEGGMMGALGGLAQSIGIDTSKIEGVFGGFVDNFSAVFDNILLPFNGIMQGLNNIADKFGNFVMSHKVEDINVNMPDLAKLDGMIASSVKKAIEEALPKTKNDNKDFRSNQ